MTDRTLERIEQMFCSNPNVFFIVKDSEIYFSSEASRYVLLSASTFSIRQ